MNEGSSMEIKKKVVWRPKDKNKRVNATMVEIEKDAAHANQVFIYYLNKHQQPKCKWVPASEVMLAVKHEHSKTKNTKQSEQRLINTMFLNNSNDVTFLFDTSEWEMNDQCLIDPKFPKRQEQNITSVDGNTDRFGRFYWSIKYQNRTNAKVIRETPDDPPEKFIHYIKSNPDKFATE